MLRELFTSMGYRSPLIHATHQLWRAGKLNCQAPGITTNILGVRELYSLIRPILLFRDDYLPMTALACSMSCCSWSHVGFIPSRGILGQANCAISVECEQRIDLLTKQLSHWNSRNGPSDALSTLKRQPIKGDEYEPELRGCRNRCHDSGRDMRSACNASSIDGK